MLKERNTLYSNLGVFIGLNTFRIDKNLESFYSNEIENLFKNYKDSLIKNIKPKSDDSLFNESYKPKAYYIFGKFDIAFISLIDDFEICGRTFRPFNYLRTNCASDYSNQAYDHKILAGIFSELPRKNGSAIIENASKTFLKGVINNNENKLPFIGICTAKINNILLLKKGYNSLHKSFIEYFLNIFREENSNFKVLLIETFGTSEYIILFFSNSYKKISEKILKLRKLYFNAKDGDNKIYTVNELENISGINFFEHTNTTFGFDFDLFLKNLNTKKFEIPKKEFLLPENYGQGKEKNEELISFNTRWFTKPILLNKFKNIHKGEDYNKEYYRIMVGLGDIIPYTRDYIPVSEALSALMREYQNMTKTQSGIITEARTFPIMKRNHSEDEDLQKIKDRNVNNGFIIFNEFKNKNKWLLSKDEIVYIDVTLRDLGIAKIVRNKIAKIISNYNTIASNPSLFLYFLDLTNYLKSTLRETLDVIKDKNSIEINKLNLFLINNFIIFERAYYNRFFQSSVTKEITDFNSEYFGAVHQTIMAYNFAYKTYSKLFTGDKQNSDFVVIGSTPRIESAVNYIKLNYFHIFQPEIFAAICSHEATNFFYDKISNKHLELFDVFNFSEYTQKGKMNSLKSLFGFELENFTNSKEEKITSKKINNSLIKKLSKNEDFFIYEDFVDQYLNEELGVIKAFSKDIITLYTSYWGDKDLFNLWHWQYFLQIPLNYVKEGEINEEKFCIYLTRLMFVLCDVERLENGKIKIENFYNSNDRNPLIAPNKILQDLWLKNYGKIKWLVEQLINVEDIFLLKKSFMNWSKLLVFYGDKNYDDNYNYSIKLIDDYNEYSEKIKLKKISDRVINKLKKGEIVVKNSEKQSDYFFVSKLIYSFLKYYQNEIWTENNKEKLLLRENGKVIIFENETKKNYTDVVVDRQGGLFSANASRRRELFKMRATFVKSLWDVSLKDKKREFLTSQSADKKRS